MLTIAIPTYNRVADLKACIESIFTAAYGVEKGKINLIVSSNASDDGTDDYITSIDTTNINLNYHRFESNVGPIKKFFKLVELSQGKWLWYLSDDDAITADAIHLILNEIESNQPPDGVTLTCIPCDSELIPLNSKIHTLPQGRSTRLDISPFSHTHLREYLHDWGLLSVCVFKTESWKIIHQQLSIPDDDCYPHVWIQSRMLAECTSWCRILQPTVLWRGDCDSFLATNGALKRALMPIATYGRLAEFYKYKHPTISSICRELSCSFIYHYALQIKKGWGGHSIANANTYMSLFKAACIFKSCKHPMFYYKSVPALLIPKWLFVLVSNKIRKTSKK